MLVTERVKPPIVKIYPPYKKSRSRQALYYMPERGAHSSERTQDVCCSTTRSCQRGGVPAPCWIPLHTGVFRHRAAFICQRVNGVAHINEGDPLLAEFPGSVFIIRVAAEKIFPNCPRYIPKMQVVEHSVYAPRENYAPPVPAWKTFEAFRDVLPARDRLDDDI